MKKLGKCFDGNGDNAEGYASIILSNMHTYESRRKAGTLGSTITNFFKKNGITLPEGALKPEDMKSYAAYDLMVLLGIVDLYVRGNNLGKPPKEIIDLMGELAAGLQEGKSILEQFPRLVIGLVEAIPKLALKVFDYGEMAIDLPKIIGMLKDSSASWYEMKFAVIKGIEGNEEGYF
ncbi:MAG: hypothetical protein NTV88_00225 [Candidatus Micrarchaeota archaeon]|nr:hypothetical protein [Candidatus Micrarchaeota archaeon]